MVENNFFNEIILLRDCSRSEAFRRRANYNFLLVLSARSTCNKITISQSKVKEISRLSS